MESRQVPGALVLNPHRVGDLNETVDAIHLQAVSDIGVHGVAVVVCFGSGGPKLHFVSLGGVVFLIHV